MGCGSSTPAGGSVRAQRLRAMARQERAVGNLSSLAPPADARPPSQNNNNTSNNNPFAVTPETPRRPSSNTRERPQQWRAPPREWSGSTSLAITLASAQGTSSSDGGNAPPTVSIIASPTAAAAGPRVQQRPPATAFEPVRSPPAHPRPSAADAPVPTFLILPDVPMLESQGAASTSGRSVSKSRLEGAYD
jgi:hypothetical protein